MILVNAYNVLQGGGVNVVISFLSYLHQNKVKFICILPINDDYKKFVSNKNFKVYWVPSGLTRYIYKLIIKYKLNFIIKSYQVSKVFTMGNVGFKSIVPQVILVQNAFAILNEKSVWKRIDIFSRIYLKMMKFYILRNLKYASKIIVQTKSIKNSLALKYNFNNIIIAPNVINYKELSDYKISNNEFDGTKFKLLFLSKYYPHKNFEILVDVCRIIKKLSLDVSISLTLDENKLHDSRMLNKLNAYEDIIKNIGIVEYSNLNQIYESHHAIFLPSLLESFSSTYIEAIYFKRLILTSDRDFAREVCGNYAVYFDPLSPEDIVQKIIFTIDNFNSINNTISKIKTNELISLNDTDAINHLILNSI